MWEVNRLKGARFYEGLGEFTLDSPGFWDTDKNNITENLIPVHFKVSGLVADTNKSLTSYKMRVYPTETYSASIFCKTFDYRLFDGIDPQVELILTGYNEDCTASTELMRVGKNKEDFPAQDWFRLKLENIIIPQDIHFLELKASLKRNGDVLFLYPCIEFGETATNLNIYNSNIGDYYTNIIYEGVTETNEIIKTENIAFDRLNQETEKIQRNFYLLTADEEGISYYEDRLEITPDIKKESLEFRRQRVLSRVSNTVPYSFPFLQTKLDALLGSGKWDAYLDFDNYILYIEYTAADYLWSEEIKITIMDIKPCNIVFRAVPRLVHSINVNETVKKTECVFNYPAGFWEIGKLPIATFGASGDLKLSQTPSIKTEYLNQLARAAVDKVSKIVVSDGISSYEIPAFSKNVEGNVAEISYNITEDCVLSIITNVSIYDIDEKLLTSSNIYVETNTDLVVMHKFPVTEGGI